MAEVYVASFSYSSDATSQIEQETFYKRISSTLLADSGCIVINGDIDDISFRTKLDEQLEGLIKSFIEKDLPAGHTYDSLVPIFASVVWYPGVPPRHDIHRKAISYKSKDGAGNTSTQQWKITVDTKSGGFVFLNAEWRKETVIA